MEKNGINILNYRDKFSGYEIEHRRATSSILPIFSTFLNSL